jgi:hypothetical protein
MPEIVSYRRTRPIAAPVVDRVDIILVVCAVHRAGHDVNDAAQSLQLAPHSRGFLRIGASRLCGGAPASDLWH